MTRTLVVAHDAGGAEVISAWIRREAASAPCDFLLEGPAVAIFERKLSLQTRVEREAAFADIGGGAYGLVLTGSSWATDLERSAVRAARGAGIRSVTYLDHWVRYPERFEIGGEHVLPDELWAGDRHAVALAREHLPDAHVRLVPNVYWDDVRAAIEAQPAPRGGERTLYVTEPTSRVAEASTGDPRGFGYDEREALRGYLDLADPAVPLRLRPHPAEEPGKYDDLLADRAADRPAEVSNGHTLEQDIAWATRVVGCDSMAMAIAVVAGRDVVCAIPPGGRPPSLPFPEIRRLYAERMGADDLADHSSARSP